MSHFTVLVIGENVEEQLEPYNENTDVPAYIDGSPADTLKALVNGLEYYQTDADPKEYVGKTVETLTKAEKLKILDAWDGGEYREDDGGNLIRYTTYNPASKWDWYEIGGRWSGFFLVKPGTPEDAYKNSGTHWTETFNVTDPKEKARLEKEVKRGRTDQTLLKYIDVELMRTEAGVKANETFDKLEEITKGLTPPTESWSALVDRHLGDLKGIDFGSLTEEQRLAYRERVDVARKERNTSGWIRAVMQEMHIFDDPYEYFHLHAEDPRASYVQDRVNGAVATYAVVKDGVWYGRGDMGWWGMASNEQDEAEWTAKVAELLDGLPEDTLITLIDAHI